MEASNNAKLREALELARLYISLGPEAESRAKVKNGQIEMLHAIDVIDKVSTALASPPRNCDKYSHDQALRIWSAEPDNQMNGCFDDWLYAPATEEEGGNDGNE